MQLSSIPNYLDKAFISEIGEWLGGGVPTIATLTAGAFHLSKSLKTSTLPTTIIFLVAAIGGTILNTAIAHIEIDFLEKKSSDRYPELRWKNRFKCLIPHIGFLTPIIMGGAALKYLAPQSSIIANSAFLLGNCLAAASIGFISNQFFQGRSK